METEKGGIRKHALKKRKKGYVLHKHVLQVPGHVFGVVSSQVGSQVKPQHDIQHVFP
jgi:hypothetical protein